MIVRTMGERLLLVRQTDHQVLAGELAEAWGNDRFARPEPFSPLARAAFEHDNGWRAWEEAPAVDPATKRPYQFTDVPVEQHLTFYRQAVEELAGRDAHAGLLACLHCQGFHNQRFGTLPEAVMTAHPAEREHAVRCFLADLQALGRQLGRTLDVPLPVLWAQYELLQVFDRLSLYLCMPPQKAAELGPVPVAPGGETVALTLTLIGGDEIAVSPWPFRESEVAASVPARLVPLRDYASDEEFRRAYARPEEIRLHYTLREQK